MSEKEANGKKIIRYEFRFAFKWLECSKTKRTNTIQTNMHGAALKSLKNFHFVDKIEQAF